MNPCDKAIIWGEWVKRRMLFMGFRSQKTFARQLGCSEDQLCRWLQMQEPPQTMRKGFDYRMMQALRTDASTLFVRYRDEAPEESAVIAPDAKENELRREIVNAAMSLPVNRLRVLGATASALRELALAG